MLLKSRHARSHLFRQERPIVVASVDPVIPILIELFPGTSGHRSLGEEMTRESQILVAVVVSTTLCFPGCVTIWTTWPADTGADRANVRPVVRFVRVGVPGPVIVQTGYVLSPPVLRTLAAPITEPDANRIGSSGRIPVAFEIENRSC
jgi:hypothetical protein